MYEDSSSFDDYAVHAGLKRSGIKNVGGEWFCFTVNGMSAAIIAVRTCILNTENRAQSFSMSSEKEEAVAHTIRKKLSLSISEIRFVKYSSEDTA